MARSNLEDVKLYDPIIVKGVKWGVHVETKAGAWTIDRDQAFLSFITLTGAGQTATLPAAELGLMFMIRNTSASALTITINNPAAALVGTIVQNAAALLYSDGVNWFIAPF